MRTVLVPAIAGLFSAVGLLFARPEFHEVRTCHLDVDAVDPAVVAGALRRDGDEARPRARGALRDRVGADRGPPLRRPELGGRGRLPGRPIDAGVLAALRARFEDEHERLYGVKDQAGSPVEIRALRLAALGEVAATSSFQLEANARGLERRHSPDRRNRRVQVRTRSSFGEAPEPGPLLVDEYDTTVVVPPGWSARRDAGTGTLILERGADGG